MIALSFQQVHSGERIELFLCICWSTTVLLQSNKLKPFTHPSHKKLQLVKTEDSIREVYKTGVVKTVVFTASETVHSGIIRTLTESHT